jgi:hypothetical protein
LGLAIPFGRFAKNTHAKRNHADHPLLSGKRFDATEDREQRRPAHADRSDIEVMHPNLISREQAQET